MVTVMALACAPQAPTLPRGPRSWLGSPSIPFPPPPPSQACHVSTSPTCEVTTCHTHNLFAPKTFSDLCKLLDTARLDINIFCLCVRVLQNLIKACSRRIRGVQTTPRSGRRKLLTCTDKLCSCGSGGCGRGCLVVLFCRGAGPCRPPLAPVCRRLGTLCGVLTIVVFSVCFCVNMCAPHPCSMPPRARGQSQQCCVSPVSAPCTAEGTEALVFPEGVCLQVGPHSGL